MVEGVPMHREKVCIGEILSRVRIPHSPHETRKILCIHPSKLEGFFFYTGQCDDLDKRTNLPISIVSQNALLLSLLQTTFFYTSSMFVVSIPELICHHLKNKKMETKNRTTVTVESTIKAPVEKVWKYWAGPEHITKWANASDDWHTPFAENDLREGGKFLSRMEAKDGSMGFDFGGVYDKVKQNELIEYTIGDGRKVIVHFTSNGNETKVIETFEAEDTNPIEMQRGGWQAILDNFKKYAESN